MNLIPNIDVAVDINSLAPVFIDHILNVNDTNSRTFSVSLYANNQKISLYSGNFTAKAAISVNNILLDDDVTALIQTDSTVAVTVDNKYLTLIPGVMRIQLTITRGTDVIVTPLPILARVTSDLAQTAQILPDSHSSYSEIVAEVVAARGEYNNLSESIGSKVPLSNIVQTITAQSTHNQIPTAKAVYDYTASKASYTYLNNQYTQLANDVAQLPSTADVQQMIDSLVDPTLSVQGKAADAKATGEIRTKQNILFNGLNVSFTESIVTPIVTPIYLKSGESVRITVTDKTAGNIFAYIDGHTSSSYAITISKDGVYIFTASFDGYFSLYTPLNPAPTANMLIEYISALSEKLSDVKSETKDNTAAIGSVNSTIYKTVNLAVEQGDIDTGNNGGNVNSEKSVRTPSFIEKCINISFPETHVARIFAYQGSTFVGCWSGTEFNKDWTKNLYMPSPVYMGEFFARFPDYSFRLTFWAASKTPITPADTPVNAQIEKYADKIPVYTVGAGGDFATFNGALIALANDSSEKIIEVKQGIYNIFEEYGGAEYIASLTDVDSLSWEDVSVIVPPNTTIRGIGNVVLEWNPTDSEIIDQKHAFLHSPLNLCGSCTIENIKIVCSNCRYGIHDECSGLAVFNEIVRKLKNVVVIYNASTYGVKYAYGAGHARRGSYHYENCTFSAHYGDVWSTHNYLSADTLTHATIEFVFCKFINNITNRPGNIRLSSTNANARKDSVYLNGCYANGISYGSEYSVTDVWQNYSVTSMCSSPLTDTYQGGNLIEAYREPTTQYLTING